MTAEQKAGLAKINEAIHGHNQKIVKQGNHYKKSTVTPAQYKKQKAGLDKINSVIHDHNQKIIERGKHHIGSKYTPAQQKQRKKIRKAGLEKINRAIHEHNQHFLAKHFPKSSDKPASNSVKRSTRAQKHTPNPTAKPKQMPRLSRVDRRRNQIKAKHRHIFRKLFSPFIR